MRRVCLPLHRPDPVLLWTAVLLALVLLLARCAVASGYERRLYFQPLEPRVQLAQNTVSAIHTDQFGFLWIATQAGLHRYDGHNLQLIQHDPEDPDSLADNLVTALAEDDRQQLWVGTNSAWLAVIDLRSGRLRNLPRRGDLRADRVSALHFVPGQGLWIGTGRGVEVLEPGADQARLVYAVTNPRHGHVHAIRAWHGAVHVAAHDGLYSFTPGVDEPQRWGDQPVYALGPSAGGRSLLAGMADGLYELMPSGLERRWPQRPPAPASDVDPTAVHAPPPTPVRVLALDVDGRGQVWMAVPGQGLARLQADLRTADWFRREDGVPGTLPEDRLTQVAIDPSGVLWVGGETTGLSHVPIEGARFSLIVDVGRSRRAANNVRSLLESPTGEWWIGTEGDGLKRYDPRTGQFTHFDTPIATLLDRQQSAEDLRILSLAHDTARDRLWIGSNQGLFSRETDGQFRRWSTSVTAADDLFRQAPLRSLVLESGDILWVATSGHGVMRVDAASGEVQARYRHDPTDPHSLTHDFVLKAYVDRHGHRWFGTMLGLSRLDTQGRWQRFRFDAAVPDSLPGDLVRALHEDPAGRLWVGTHSGLARVDEVGDEVRFVRTDVRRVLPSGTVYGILGDDQGRLWLSSNIGLACLDPETGHIQGFGMVEGLQGLEFNGDAALRLRDGQMLFGGLSGINRFQPALYEPSSWAAPVRLTALSHGRARRSKSFVQALQQVQIDHADRIVQFEFASLDLRDPQRNAYAYRLRGFDTDWVEGRGLAQATYTNLNPGQYVFQARASNRDGVYSPQELSITLDVRPPWWLSRLARGSYAAALALVIGISLLDRQRRRILRREHLGELRAREERLSVCLWGSGDDFWDWDIQRGVLYRHGTEQLLGTNQDGQLSELDWMRHVVHPEDLPLVRRRMEVALSGGQPYYESEHRIRGGTSDWVWVLARGKVVERDDAGRPLRMAGTARNITHMRTTQQELRIAAEVIRSMSEAVGVLDLELRFVSVNPAFERVTGYAMDEALGQPLGLLDSPRHSEAEYQTVRRQIVEAGRWHGELWLRRKNASDLCVALEAVRIRRNAEPDLSVVVMNDITQRKQAELELKYLANFDALTGLPNRTMFNGRLLQAVRRATRRQARLALLFIDLDRFKQINDTLGHAAGDELLRVTSRRMSATVPSGAIVARLGGDEFTVLLPDIAGEAAVQGIAQALLDAFIEPANLGGNEVVISPSIGIAYFPEHGEDPGTLLKHADAAMYSAKDAGRNTWRVYNDELAHLTRQRVALEAGLRRALERREFQLVFQPIVRLADRRIVALETLLRWHHPEFGTIAPDVFVPILEESGMVVTVGSWVLSEALAQLSHWRAIGFTDLRLAVNISTLQLLRGELDKDIAERLRHFDLPGECLELELTESLVMANPEQSIRSLDALAAMGVGIVVDDFGTGYSSLSYLKKLPINKLKIDKSFIRDIGRDPDDTTIVNIVIALAHVLELKAVAEGVETTEQLAFLASSGCDHVQGYLLCRPLPAVEIEQFMLDQRALQPSSVAIPTAVPAPLPGPSVPPDTRAPAPATDRTASRAPRS